MIQIAPNWAVPICFTCGWQVAAPCLHGTMAMEKVSVSCQLTLGSLHFFLLCRIIRPGRHSEEHYNVLSGFCFVLRVGEEQSELGYKVPVCGTSPQPLDSLSWPWICSKLLSSQPSARPWPQGQGPRHRQPSLPLRRALFSRNCIIFRQICTEC